MLAWSVLGLLNAIMGVVNFIIPEQIETAFEYLINTTLVFSGVFPIHTFWSVIFVYLSAYLFVFGFRIFVMVLNIIPGVQLNTGHLKR